MEKAPFLGLFLWGVVLLGRVVRACVTGWQACTKFRPAQVRPCIAHLAAVLAAKGLHLVQACRPATQAL